MIAKFELLSVSFAACPHGLRKVFIILEAVVDVDTPPPPSLLLPVEAGVVGLFGVGVLLPDFSTSSAVWY